MTLEKSKASKASGAEGWFLLFQRPKWAGKHGSLSVGTA